MKSFSVTQKASGPEPESGSPFPLGVTLDPKGANFSVFSAHATKVELLLFDGAGGAPANRVISLDPAEHRTGHYWHVHLPGVQAGQRYGYRMHGPGAPDAGDLFDADKLLLDPYGKGVDDSGYRRYAAAGAGDNQSVAMKSVVADLGVYDWEDDRAPRHPFSRTVIYEMHVGGFTRHPTSGVSAEKRGTYA